jgi:hypothetical protein
MSCAFGISDTCANAEGIHAEEMVRITPQRSAGSEQRLHLIGIVLMDVVLIVDPGIELGLG